MRILVLSLITIFIIGCGANQESNEIPVDNLTIDNSTVTSQNDITLPEWYTIENESITLDIVAGLTSAGNYWNFNGYQNGEVTVVVPVGSTVAINFQNNDPVMPHSIGVANLTSVTSAVIDPTPVFEGAISSNPTSMTESTLPGQSETISFVATEVGEFALVCYIPAHTISGMWVRLVVSEEGQFGIK